MKLIIIPSALLLAALWPTATPEAATLTFSPSCPTWDILCDRSQEAIAPTLISSQLQEQIQSLFQKGLTFLQAKDYQQALDAYLGALQLARQAKDVQSELAALTAVAASYSALKNYPKALEVYQETLTLLQQKPQLFGPVFEANILLSISMVYYLQKHYPQAIEVLREAKHLIEKQDLPEYNHSFTLALILTNLGINLFLNERVNEADSVLAEAARMYERARKLQEQFIRSAQSQAYEYEITVGRWRQEVLVALNRRDEALEIAEKNRARALSALLENRLNIAPDPKPDDRLINLEQIKAIARAQKATIVQYTVTYDTLWVMYGNIEEENVRNIFAWAIQPTGEIEFRKLNIGAREIALKESIRQMRDAIARPTRRAPSPEKPLQELHQLLIEPLSDLLPKNPDDRVIFIPQDFLFLVPFSALQDKNGKYLIEKHTILTAPSIEVLDAARTQQQQIQDSVKGAIILGNPAMPKDLTPLPGAEEEAKAIAQLFNTSPLLGSQATKAALLQRMSQARIVHLATHGILDRDSGLFSSLALAPTPQDNGFLTAREIISLKLNAELVVLSACNTGRGTINGDGVIGLSRSFIGAGVPSIIVSLWAVPDAPTAPLMTAFYQNLKAGLDKAQSLRQAMLSTRKQFPHPVNWAGFILIGAADSSKLLQAIFANRSTDNSNTSLDSPPSYYTALPVPDKVKNFYEIPSLEVPGEIDIVFQTDLSVEAVITFYRQVLSQRGLTERTELTRQTQLVFTVTVKGQAIVVQVVELPHQKLRSVSVTFRNLEPEK